MTRRFLLSGFFFLTFASWGCFYFPPKYSKTITENQREFFLFQNGKEVHVVMQTHLAARSGLPERMAWVVPFPSLPLKYEETNPGLFEELYNLLGNTDGVFGSVPEGGKGGRRRGAPIDVVKVHKSEIVGDYKVHPIEILSDQDPNLTATVLDSWLKTKGFISIPFDLQRPYIKKGAVFLAIEFTPKGQTATIKPLHLTFAKTSDTFSIPLRLTHDTRSFDLRIYTFGFDANWNDKDSELATHLVKSPFDIAYPHFNQNELESWRTTSPFLSPLLLTLNGKIRYFSMKNFNAEGHLRARELKADPTFRAEAVSVAVAGTKK